MMEADEKKVDRLAGHMVRTATQSGIELKNACGPEDVSHLSYKDDLGDPGEYPFTRGIYPEMYRNRLWLKSFIVGYATAGETNRAFREYIAKGMTAALYDMVPPVIAGIANRGVFSGRIQATARRPCP